MILSMISEYLNALSLSINNRNMSPLFNHPLHESKGKLVKKRLFNIILMVLMRVSLKLSLFGLELEE